jgi:two-component system, NtrC family, response regulator HydG
MVKILIVDDDAGFCTILKSFLHKKGYQAFVAHSYQDAYKLFSEGNTYEIVLTDFRLPDKTGMELLKMVKKHHKDAIVILMTAYADIRVAVKAIKAGAYEYVTKPVNPDEILLNIEAGLEKLHHKILISEPQVTKGIKERHGDFEYVHGSSRFSKEIHDHINLVAPTDMSVIIQGESGTGKEYIARKIHFQSHRNKYPFVAIDCGSLSNELAGSEFFGHIKGSFTGAINDKIGQFEVANKGTLFLDEIGNLSYEVQVKLLRAIQERKIRKIGSNNDITVDVRLITATNEDLQRAVKKGTFREDLYHRLNEFSILVSPLRERKDDIKIFVNHFLNKANFELSRNVQDIPPLVMDSLLNYHWPGNIREVKNVIKRAVLLSRNGELLSSSLPHEITRTDFEKPQMQIETNGTDDLKLQTEKTEKEVIITTLLKARYNKSRAAKLLNIDRKTLYNKIKHYGIAFD